MSSQLNAGHSGTGLSLPQSPLDPGFHCVRVHWIRAFIAFQLAKRTRAMMLIPFTPVDDTLLDKKVINP
jgi:hypothetical protein